MLRVCIIISNMFPIGRCNRRRWRSLIPLLPISTKDVHYLASPRFFLERVNRCLLGSFCFVFVCTTKLILYLWYQTTKDKQSIIQNATERMCMISNQVRRNWWYCKRPSTKEKRHGNSINAQPILSLVKVTQIYMIKKDFGTKNEKK